MTTKHNSPTLENVADDEPIFVLRAQDENAPDTIDAWADATSADGANQEKIASARGIADQMREWQRRNGSKLPD